MKKQFVPFVTSILSAALAVPAMSLAAEAPQDRIEVLGRIVLSAGPVNHLIATQHYGRYYLYAEEGGGIAVIDITNAKAPSLVSNVSSSENPSGGVVAMSGTAALVSSSAAPAAAPQSVRIVNLADPAHPTVTREFAGVTAIGHDRDRGLIFLANSEGVWILKQQPAEDPALARAYANYVLYNH
jgi:hypothetical protein